MKKICPIFIFAIFLLLFLCACGGTVNAPESVVVRAEYTAGEGGTILGTAVQEHFPTESLPQAYPVR